MKRMQYTGRQINTGRVQSIQSTRKMPQISLSRVHDDIFNRWARRGTKLYELARVFQVTTREIESIVQTRVMEQQETVRPPSPTGPAAVIQLKRAA